jgi:hypothetical protein
MKATCTILIHWSARSVGKNGVTCWVTGCRPLVGKYWYNIKTWSTTPMEVFNSHIPGKVKNHLHYCPKVSFVNFNILTPHLEITYSSTTFSLHHLISYTRWQKGEGGLKIIKMNGSTRNSHMICRTYVDICPEFL